jgi:exodeoxyribonuclease VIII
MEGIMIQPGLYYDISNEDYHGSKEYLSSSQLKLILKDPELFYRTYIKGEKKKESDTEKFDIGTALHTKILEPDKFDSQVTYYSGTKRGKAWDTFKEENEGKIVLGDIAKFQIDRMYNSVITSYALPYVTGGKSEVSLFTKLHDQKIRVRADHLFSDKIVDLKSTSGLINEENFSRTVEYLGYALSAALYCDAFDIQDFYWVVTSKDFEQTVVFRVSAELLQQGRSKYLKAIEMYKKYEKEGWTFAPRVITLRPRCDNSVNFDFAI